MKLRQQEAVLNHGKEAQDWLPVFLLHLPCPSTQPSPTSQSRGRLQSPGHFLQEQECEQGVTSDATEGTPRGVFSAAGCRLPHTLAVGKNGECVVKSHPYPSRAPLWDLCRSVELLTRLPFAVEADQAPAPMLLEVSAPLIQLCPALQ